MERFPGNTGILVGPPKEAGQEGRRSQILSHLVIRLNVDCQLFYALIISVRRSFYKKKFGFQASD